MDGSRSPPTPPHEDFQFHGGFRWSNLIGFDDNVTCVNYDASDQCKGRDGLVSRMFFCRLNLHIYETKAIILLSFSLGILQILIPLLKFLAASNTSL
jgi:hypothetical protein